MQTTVFFCLLLLLVLLLLWRVQKQTMSSRAAREMAIFDPTESTSLEQSPKNWCRWLLRRPLWLCQIWCKSVHESVWANDWNITIYLFIYFYISFGKSHTGETRRRIFTLDGSNDAGSRNGVPFGAWIGVFEPNGQIIESFILSKLLHRLQPNFAQR